jgi:acetylornithine deacetylase
MGDARVSTVVEHLLELIQLPSVSSMSNRAVVEYATDVLRGAGWKTFAQKYVDEKGVEKINLIAAPSGEDPEQSAVELAFVCHTDTVPYAQDWVEAVHPFIAEDVVYGCGACDVKGFLACLLAAVEANGDRPLQQGVRIILTADEEIGCLGANQLLSSGRLAPRRVVIGEPTSLHPARAGKGYCLAEVTVYGAEAHSAHPQQGRSAIYDAARLIGEVERLARRIAEERNEFFEPPFTTINIGTVQGGTAKNVVPGRCSFLLEWRPIPEHVVNDVPDAVLEIGNELQRLDPGFRFELKILRQQAGFETLETAALTRTMERITGRAPIAIPFGSEANVFGSVAEEIIVFGAGDMRTAHSSRECVPVSELHEAVLCLEALMYGL